VRRASTDPLTYIDRCKLPLEGIDQLERELEWTRIRLAARYEVERLVELQQDIETLKRKIRVLKDKQLKPL
jgi:hypothetical protein